MATFPLRILTTNSVFFDGECESLVVPTVDGAYGIMAHHTDFVSAIVDGELKFRPQNEKEFLFISISNGILSVKDNEATILCDTARGKQEADEEKAKQAYLNAKLALENSHAVFDAHISQTGFTRPKDRRSSRQIHD